MKIFLPLIVLTGFSTHVLHNRVSKLGELRSKAEKADALPAPEALQLLSLGYGPLVADYYWLRAISYFGDKRNHSSNYPALSGLVERTLYVDPYFAGAYYFAGLSLTLRGMDISVSTRLLERGLRYRPDDWRIAFILGFNAYHFAGDFKRGAEALSRAAQIPGAPPIAGYLAARLAAHSGEPELGLQLIDSLIADTQDPELKKGYEERKKLLLVELHIKWLSGAATRYKRQHNAPPRDILDLVAPGLMHDLPEHPLDGRYIINDHGEVDTEMTGERLRLPKGALAR